MSLGLPELIIIVVIVLLLFGGSRLPQLSRSIGQSIREMRESFDSANKPPKKKSEEDKKPENKD